LSFSADGAGVRLVRAALLIATAVGLAALWTNRAVVLDAYRLDEQAQTEAGPRLTGVDLAYRVGEVEPSPYHRPTVPAGPGSTSPIPSLTVDPARPSGDPAVPTAIGGGEAALSGVVSGPDGPLFGALVRLERVTRDGRATMDITTDVDGAWSVTGLLGGRYRIRAWVPNLLTMGRSEVRYVADGETSRFDVSLWGVDPSPTLEFVDPGPLHLGVPAVVAVFLGSRAVDADGLVVTRPVTGAEVTVAVTPQVELLTEPVAFTDGNGVVFHQLRCLTLIDPVSSTGPPGVVQAPADEAAQSPAQVATPTNPPAGQSAGQSTGESPATTTVSQGTLNASTGGEQRSFPLPGCVPVPPEPESEFESESEFEPGTEPSSAPPSESVDG
jgi:hypothetical protein